MLICYVCMNYVIQEISPYSSFHRFIFNPKIMDTSFVNEKKIISNPIKKKIRKTSGILRKCPVRSVDMPDVLECSQDILGTLQFFKVSQYSGRFSEIFNDVFRIFLFSHSSKTNLILWLRASAHNLHQRK